MTILDRPGGSRGPDSESKVSFLILISPELLTVKLKTTPGPPPICISNERSHRAEQFAVETVSSKCIIPSETEGKGEVKVKMYQKCMEKMFNYIFQHKATLGFKFDVRQSCRARRALSFI